MLPIFSAPNVYHLDGWELFYRMPGTTARAWQERWYSIRSVTTPRCAPCSTLPLPHLHVDRHDNARQKQILAETFAGEGWEIPRLLDGMWKAPDFYFDRIAQTHMERWSSGRVALLGDAAYCPSPLSGMGTSLALVGAYVLAGELATAGDDYHHRIYPLSAGDGRSRHAGAEVRRQRTWIPVAEIAHAGVDDQSGHAHDGALAAQSPHVQWCREGGERRHAQGLSSAYGCDARNLSASIPAPERPGKVLPTPRMQDVGLPLSIKRLQPRTTSWRCKQQSLGQWTWNALHGNEHLLRLCRFPGPRARADAREDRPSAQCAHSVRHRAYHGLSGHRADQ